MLYLVATPIGNLQDFSFRALDILKTCDYILCEDTRHSSILLHEYQIKKPLKSFHMFNEKNQEDRVIWDLKEGKIIALISDAGTPGICDPGEELVKRCKKEGLKVRGVPGSCAWTLALSLSCMNKDKVQFLGFIPKKKIELKKRLAEILTYSGTSIFYDTPHQILDTLTSIAQLDPQRPLCIMRELTKKFEEHLDGTAETLLAHFHKEKPRGEIVVLVEGQHETYDTLSPQDHVQLLQKTYGLSLAEAIKVCAELKEVPKRTIYNEFHHSDDC
jgi:16S rRNA (cytidine1402-2'-O)-methyltransferase